MSDMQPNNLNPDANDSTLQNTEPFIPPSYLLILAGIGFLVALFVLFTQPTFSVFGYGGLGLAVLSLLAYALLAPGQARSAVTGRTVRYGGTSLIVTLIVIVMLAVVYLFVRGQNLRYDLTESDQFSLTAESEGAIVGYAADPNLPDVRFIAFYGTAQAGLRDRNASLFDSYVTASNGKISYEFVDPVRNPQQAQLYGITQQGQIAVASVTGTDANGEPVLDTENVTLVTSANQAELTNAVLSSAAQGNFIGYFLSVRDNQSAEMSVLKSIFTDRYDWTVEDVSLVDLTAPNSERRLNDPNADGQVLVIPGGSAALSEAERAILEDYLANGGDLVIFAGTNLNEEGTALATDAAFNEYLFNTFGVRFNSDNVIDQTQAFQSPLYPAAIDLDTSAFVTTNGVPTQNAAIIFELPHSITLSDTPPAGVTTTTLASSGASAYAISDVQRILTADQNNNNLTQQEGDLTGPFVLAAQAENSATGGRVVLFGSTSVATDTYALFSSDVDNLQVAANALTWTTNFNNFVQQITIQQEQRPQDQPLFADAQVLRNINFITVILLPFGVLIIGLLVWWNNRERAKT